MVNGNPTPSGKWSSSNTETLEKIYRIYNYKFTNKANIWIFYFILYAYVWIIIFFGIIKPLKISDIIRKYLNIKSSSHIK